MFMKPLEIHKVTTKQERRAFLSFPWKVYQDNPYWVPPILSERMEFTDPDHNPFFKHAEVDFFMAVRGDDIVGTISAFTDERHNQFQNENIGFFGFFEVLEDQEAAQALLKTAADWARDRGHTALRGPGQFTTNDECGLLVEGFDDRPRILMTYNPPYYMEYLEANGFSKSLDLWAYHLKTEDFMDHVGERMERLADRIKKRRNITVRRINLKNLDPEIEKVKQVYNSAWSANWGFVPLTDAEIDKIAEELKVLADPDLILLAEIDDKPVGVSLTIPDLNKPLQMASPRPGTPTWWVFAKLFWHWKIRRQVDWIRVYAMGVLPEYRGMGIDALFYHETAKTAVRKGIPDAEMSWILENNQEMNEIIRNFGGEVYKTYRFYEKKLA
jgi:GNAT superfamily N-acetyltransferase